MPKRIRFDDYLAAALRKSKSPRLKAAGMAYPYAKMAYPYVKKGVKRVFRKAKRPVKRKYAPRPSRGKYVPSRAGAVPKYRIGRYMGNYKKGRKPPVGRVAERHIDTSYTIDQNMVNYVGFQTYGSMGDILLTYCMALCREIAQKSRIQLTSFHQRMQDQDNRENTSGGYVEPVDRSRLGTIQFCFSKVDMHGNKIMRYTNYYPLNEDYSQTWLDFAGWIRDQMFITCGQDGYSPDSYALSYINDFTTLHNADPATTEFNGADGYGGTNVNPFYVNKTWGEDIVQFACKSITKVNNVTPAGTDRHDINDVNANPLQGKLYDFKHSAPKFTNAWITNIHDAGSESYPDIDKLQSTHLRQDMLQTQRLRMRVPVQQSDDFTYTALHPDFKQPPRGTTIWSNIDGVQNVHMQPGGFKTIVRSGIVKASTARFIAGVLFSRVDVNNITLSGLTQTVTASDGTNIPPDYDKRIRSRPVITPSFILALEPTVRTETNEEVKLVVNRDLHHTCKIRRAPTRGTAKQVTVRGTVAWPVDYEDNNQVYVDST